MGNSKEKIPARNLTIVTREERRVCGMLFDPDARCAYGLNPAALLAWKLEGVVRRVISASSGTYCTKGDNNLEAVLGSIDRGRIAGLVTSFRRNRLMLPVPSGPFPTVKIGPCNKIDTLSGRG